MPLASLKPVARILIWLVIGLIIAISVVQSISSPLLQWRDPIYQLASFAGVGAFIVMLFQPLMVVGRVPGVPRPMGRRLHRFLGALLVALVVIHVGALWITSPPDVIDALFLASPTPFSVWGVMAMWALFGAALVAAFRLALRIRFSLWRRMHLSMVLTAVAGTILHTLLIEGVMETWSKIALCALVAGALLVAMGRGRVRD